MSFDSSHPLLFCRPIFVRRSSVARPECLKDSMLAELEKRSPELGRNARYVTKSAISRLPHYLTVQFVRFFWKRRDDGAAGVKAKILKKITFPISLDMYDFCADDLKKSLKVCEFGVETATLK